MGPPTFESLSIAVYPVSSSVRKSDIPLTFATRLASAASLVFLVGIAVAAALLTRLETSADDVAYITVGKELGAWTAAVQSYQFWSGRFALNFLLFSAILSSWAWKMFIVAGLLLLCASIARLLAVKAMPGLNATALVLALLLGLTGRHVQFEGMWWATGSFNYLVPVALGLFAVGVLFHAHDAGPLQRACGLIAAAIAAYQEQMAVSLTLVAIGVAVWHAWPRTAMPAGANTAPANSSFAKLFLFVVVLNTAFQLLAPGNKVRFERETETWFPAFDDLHLWQKLLLGMERLGAHLVPLDTKTFHVLLVATLLILWQRRGAWRWPAAAAGLVLAGHLVFTLLRRTPLGADLPYPAIVVPKNETGLYISGFAVFWVMLTAGAMMAVRLAMANSSRERLLAALPWLVAIGSVTMMGLSPTVYASGWRVLYVADVMLIIALLDMLHKAGWLAGRTGLWITWVAIIVAAWRVTKYGAAFFLRS